MKKLIRFLVAGLPSFLVAIPLNYFLVSHAHLAKPLAYAVVLVVQVTINFFVCRFYVFNVKPDLDLWRSFGAFFWGILLFRLADWGLYVLLTSWLSLNYLGIQFLNAGLFAILKFRFATKVFEAQSGQIVVQPKAP